MECLYCKGRMVRAAAPFSIDRKGYHIVWEAIPAWVCTQCGEPFFEAGEVESIQRALVAVDREPSLEDVQVHRVVVGDEDVRRGPHGTYSRILARSARGLKGLVT